MRSKERIQLILATALKLFHKRGIDQVTTNDIAEAAGIPIGSIYRYFQNKEEIILAIVELQVEDVTTLFEKLAADPALPKMSWEKIIRTITDTWLQHARSNDSFAFIHFVRCSKKLNGKVKRHWEKVQIAYTAILHAREPELSLSDARVYLQLTWSTVEIGIGVGGDEHAHKAAHIIASHLDQHYK
jgi:AcrR family transcriptional regulator